MKKSYIKIDLDNLNMNIEEDKKLINELENVLAQFGYKHRIFEENSHRCVAKYYHDSYIVKGE